MGLHRPGAVSFPRMDAPDALADLTEISAQVEAAVVLGEDGSVEASTLADDGRAERLGRTAHGVLAAADELSSAGRSLLQLEVVLREGSLFVVREPGRSIAATTTPSPTSSLVLHDLKTCLRRLAEPAEKPKQKPKPRRKAKKAAADA